MVKIVLKNYREIVLKNYRVYFFKFMQSTRFVNWLTQDELVSE